MHKHLLGAICILAWANAGAARAADSNNQAFINQQSSTVPTLIVNDTSFVQSGTGNRIGSETNNATQSATGDGASTNVFTAIQSSNGNAIGFLFGTSITMPFQQSGSGNVASITQQGGDGNTLGQMTQENRSGPVSNTVSLIQEGRSNYVLAIEQQSDGLVENVANIRQRGDYNGFTAGIRPGVGQASSVAGALLLGSRSQIGLADAPLSNLFGSTVYVAPNERPGATLFQAGGGNQADINEVGSDNSFTVQQKSGGGGYTGNTFTYSVAGSGNYGYALQVGSNLTTDVVAGTQNIFLVYQAGYAGSAENGYGNLVTWQQGTSAADMQNFTEIVQLGFNNSVSGYQFGRQNSFVGTQQGQANQIYSGSNGVSNVISAAQFGSNNSLTAIQGATPRR